MHGHGVAMERHTMTIFIDSQGTDLNGPVLFSDLPATFTCVSCQLLFSKHQDSVEVLHAVNGNGLLIN